MQKKWPLIAGVSLGLLAVFLVNLYIQQLEAKLRIKSTREVQVLVAAKDIAKGSTIDYDVLGFKVVPVNFVEPGALNAKESAVGKTALLTIKAGEQILSSKLVAPEKGLTLAGKTPPGKRAFTIDLDAISSVAGMVRPGDHVDVLAIFTTPAVTLTLFQDILVLAVGQEMVPELEERRGRSERSSAKSSITLALSPQEVQILTVAIQHGKISLTLRPRMEKLEKLPAVDLSNLPPVLDLNTLLQLYLGRPRETVMPDKGTEGNVEVIRGLKKELTPVPTGN